VLINSPRFKFVKAVVVLVGVPVFVIVEMNPWEITPPFVTRVDDPKTVKPPVQEASGFQAACR
jgi:hypothetical protein